LINDQLYHVIYVADQLTTGRSLVQSSAGWNEKWAPWKCVQLTGFISISNIMTSNDVIVIVIVTAIHTVHNIYFSQTYSTPRSTQHITHANDATSIIIFVRDKAVF